MLYSLVVFPLLLVCLSGALARPPHQKSVNPCGIVYDRRGSEWAVQLQARRALSSRIREIMPLLNASFPKEFSDYKPEAQIWIPDSSNIDESMNLPEKLFEINRDLRRFSCALDILERHVPHSKACSHHLPEFDQLVKNHRLLVCETDAALGVLGFQWSPEDYPALQVEVTSDWYNKNCTTSRLIHWVVYNKYRHYLNAVLSVIGSDDR